MIYNFNFKNLFDNNNGRKFIVLGVSLLAIGIYCMSRKSIGINVFSWGLGLIFVYASWISLKSLNELTRYADKKEINRARLNCIGFVLIALFLFVFPKVMNIVLSIALGVFLIYRELMNYSNYRRFSGNYFGASNIVKFVIGITLILSPLLLSRFLVNILSAIVIIFGIYFISTGIKIINGQDF